VLPLETRRPRNNEAFGFFSELFKAIFAVFFSKKDDESDESARKRRAEESIKARAEQVEREKAEMSREIDSERQKHRLEEAVQHFKALLADMVLRAFLV